jgi:hypothetical protein
MRSRRGPPDAVSGLLASRVGPVRGRLDGGAMRTTTPHINSTIWHLTALLALVATPLLVLVLLAATAPVAGRFDTVVDDPWGLGEGSATAGLKARQNDPLAIEAFFGRESYRPGSTARLQFVTAFTGVRLQVFHVGPEWQKTMGNMEMHGLSVTKPVILSRVGPGLTASIRIGDWPTGLYFAQVTGRGGRIGYAPFVVPPKRLGQNRVAVVMPTRTWQAYNFRDDDRDGQGDTWYATPGHVTARLYRPFLNRGVPPHFRAYDLYFLHWLTRTGKRVDILSQAELDGISPAALRKAYDLIVFPGHHEYVTTGEYDAVEGFRDRGGSLVMLSADNFFWRIDLKNGVMTRIAKWRELDRPEAALLGVQYIGNDMGEHRGAWQLRKAPATSWLFAGTGYGAGTAFSNAGIEIDHTNSSSPKGTQVIGELPNLLGPGMTGQMTYYSTPRGAQVFSAGAFSLAGSIRQKPVAQLLENIWARFAGAPPTLASISSVH